jgi:hypothetical protein
MTTRAMRSIATRAIDDRDERPTAVHKRARRVTTLDRRAELLRGEM